jgi:hypothetical protein
VEERHDLERVLLDGLPAEQRQLARRSIDKARAKKLAKLRLDKQHAAETLHPPGEHPPGPASG